MIGWIIAIIFICLYLDSRSQISFLKKRIKSITEKYTKMLNEKDAVLEANGLGQPHIESQPIKEHVQIPIPNKSPVSYERQPAEFIQQQASDDSERKNTAILATGALLIVIAAIVFLTSTWSILTAPFKIGILLILLFVFFQASKIAKNKLNLPKASTAFFYIAMAYIPICLCAFSFLGLLGNYFSILGAGKFIYFTICSALTGGIYYYNYKKTNSKQLYVGSLTCGLGSIVLLSLIFSVSITQMIFLVLVYNAIQLILFKILRKDITKIHNNFLVGTSFTCSIIYLLFVITQHPEIFAMTSIKSLVNTIHQFNDLSFPLSVLIPIMGAVNSLVHYTTKREDIIIAPYYIFSYIIPLVSLFELIDGGYSVPMIVAIVELILIVIKVINGVVFKYIKSERDNLGAIDYTIFLCSNIALYLYTLASSNNIFINSLLSSAVIAIVFITLLLMKRRYNVKATRELLPIAFCVSTSHLLYAFTSTLSVTTQINCFVVYYILVLLAGTMCNKKFEDLINGNILLGISGICSFSATFLGLTLNLFNSQMMLLPSLIMTTGIIGYLYYTNRKLGFLRGFLYYLAFYILVFTLDLIPSMTRNIQYSISGLVIGYGIALYSLYKRNITFDVVFSLIAVICALLHIDNVYIRYFLILLWEFAYLFSSNSESIKNFFKGILYITGYTLYVTILNDLNMQDYLFLYIIGLYITAILFSKTILNKYENNEYYLLGILYLISLFIYQDSITDGVICVTFMIGTMIFSYIKGYGALFVCTMISVIVNILLLTRSLWFSMPWWVYLLIVGILLISFAMRNERNEQKKKLELKNSLKNIQDLIDNK